LVISENYKYILIETVVLGGLIFISIFTVLVLIGKNINFSPLVGAENQFFTLFQFFGPIAGGFLGAIFGAIAVLFAELIDFFVVGKEASLVNILRLTPMIFAAYYFGTKKKNWGVAVPLIAILAFVLHPVGREVWFFTLFWTIPIIGKLLPNKYSNNVLVKSYGATFAAHSIGGGFMDMDNTYDCWPVDSSDTGCLCGKVPVRCRNSSFLCSFQCIV